MESNLSQITYTLANQDPENIFMPNVPYLTIYGRVKQTGKDIGGDFEFVSYAYTSIQCEKRYKDRKVCFDGKINEENTIIFQVTDKLKPKSRHYKEVGDIGKIITTKEVKIVLNTEFFANKDDEKEYYIIENKGDCYHGLLVYKGLYSPAIFTEDSETGYLRGGYYYKFNYTRINIIVDRILNTFERLQDNSL